MSSQSYSQLQYPLSDFVESGGVVSPVILKQELTDAGLSVTVNSVSVSDVLVNMFLLGMILEADVTLVDAVVAAHTGSAFSSKHQKAILQAEATNNTTTDETRVSLDSGVLPAGIYTIMWYAEIAVTSLLANTGASVAMVVTKNGNGAVEAGSSVNDLPYYTSFSGSYQLEVTDGDQWVLALTWKRIGTSSNPAKIRRARIFLSPEE